MNKNTYKEQIDKLKNEIYQTDLKHIYEKNYKYVKSFVKSKVSKLLLPETFNEMNSEEFYINLRTNQYLAENEMSYANFFNFCQFDFEKSLCNIEQYMRKPSIFVTFHFGSYYSIVGSLVKLEIDLCVVVDAITYENKKNVFQLLHNTISPGSKLEIINIESRPGLFQLIKSIKAKKSILFYFDGNTGITGIDDISNLIKIDFFNSEISVKKGIPSFSHKFGLPIIFLYTKRDENIINKYYAVDIIFPNDEIEKYTQQTTKFIWKQMCDIIRENPFLWEGWLYLNRYHIRLKKYYPVADSANNKILEFNCLYDMFLLNNKFYLFGLEEEICFETSESIYKLLNYIKNKTIEISRIQFYSLINKDSYCDSLIKQGIIY